MSAVDIVAAEFIAMGAKYPRSGAKIVLKALKKAGYAVVELPAVITDEWGDRTVPVEMSDRRSGFLRIEPPGESHKGVPLPGRISSLGVPTPIVVGDAPAYAAALLAAANAAGANE